MGYQIHEICTKFILRYSLFSLFLSFLPILPVSILPAVYFLAAVTNIEIAKTDTSFWLFFLFLRILARVIVFSFAKKIFNIGEIFLFLLGNNINTCYRIVLTLTLPLFIMALRTFLIVLVFFFGLMDGKLLFLTRFVHKRDMSGFILPRIFILCLYLFVALDIFDIDLLEIKK